MRRDLEHLTIGGFAKLCGVRVETVRFYQRRGVLRAPERWMTVPNAAKRRK